EIYLADNRVVSTADHSTLRTLPFTQGIPLSGFIVSPSGDRIYARNEVVDVQTNTLLAPLPIDITTGSSWAGAPVPGGPATSSDGAVIFANNSVVRVDTNQRTSIPTGATGNFMSDIALSPDGSRLLVSEYSFASGRLKIYDGTTFQLLGTVGGIGDFS